MHCAAANRGGTLLYIRSIWHEAARNFGVCLAVSVVSLASGATSLAGEPASYTGACYIEYPLFHQQGLQATFGVAFYECSNDGPVCQDTVNIEIPGLPKGAKFSPTQTTSCTNTTITLTMPPNSHGSYPLNVGGMGVGGKCNYLPCPLGSIKITKPPPKPTITSEGNKSAVWWFNGQHPTGFTKQLTLTANPVDATKYTWSVDGQYAKFVDPTTNPAVLEPDCAADTPCPPQGEGEVTVTVTGNGVTSDPFKAHVLTPYQAIPMDVPPDVPDNKGAGALFYFSHIPYQITDQFGKPLPVKPPVREHFTAAAINQCKIPILGVPVSCNWHASHEGGSGESGRLGGTGCSTSGTGVVCDTISGQAKDQLPLVPSIPQPECPNNNCSSSSIGSSTLKVLCFPGELWVGNGTSPPAPPQGVRVMTMIWQRYQDHARHCNITSPLDGSGTTVDACTCP